MRRRARRAARPKGRSTFRRFFLPAVATLVVALASAFGWISDLRLTSLRLWHADWSAIGTSASVAEDVTPDQLKLRILQHLNDPEIQLGLASGVATSEFMFDGCFLEHRLRFVAERCTGAQVDGVAGFIDRVDLRNLITQKAYVSQPGRLLPGEAPGTVRSEISYSWVPRIENDLLAAAAAYVLADPDTVREGSVAERIELGAELTSDIEAGDYGAWIGTNHREVQSCSGARLIQPPPLPAVLYYTAPDNRASAIDLIQALGERLCVPRGWVVDF